MKTIPSHPHFPFSQRGNKERGLDGDKGVVLAMKPLAFDKFVSKLHICAHAKVSE